MSSVLAEARRTLALATPIIVGQVSQMLMGITDSFMIGQVGTVPLAASAFAGTIWGMVFIIGIGLLVPVAVFVARAHGARREDEAAEYLRHGLVVALGYGVVWAAGLTAMAGQLHRFGQPPEVVAEVNPYFVIIAWSLVPTLLFQVLRQFAEAMGRPWLPMGLMLAGVGLNVLLNWILIYGHWGCPALGLTGAGWATLIARTLGLVALGWWLRVDRDERLRAAWPAEWGRRLTGARMREMAHIGVPAAGMLCFESGAFTAAALMIGLLGAVPLAAHQVALSCAAFTFMFPLGLSMAVSMRMGRAVGEGRREALRAIGFGALGLSTAIMGFFAIVIAVAGDWIAARFVPDDPGVAVLAARLLVVAVVFQIFDGGQVVGAGALRGLADVKVPAAITFLAYWVIAIPGGWLASQHWGGGAMGVWVALAGGLAVAAVLLAWRLAGQTRVRLAP